MDITSLGFPLFLTQPCAVHYYSNVCFIHINASNNIMRDTLDNGIENLAKRLN